MATKIKQPIYEHRYVNGNEAIELHHIRTAEAIRYEGGQRDTRLLASNDGIYYRWYISYGGYYRPQIKSDNYEVIGIVDISEDGTYSQ